MNKKTETPNEEFSDDDAEMLVKHYGERPEESTVERIMEDAEKSRSAFLKKELKPERRQSRGRNR